MYKLITFIYQYLLILNNNKKIYILLTNFIYYIIKLLYIQNIFSMN